MELKERTMKLKDLAEQRRKTASAYFGAKTDETKNLLFQHSQACKLLAQGEFLLAIGECETVQLSKEDREWIEPEKAPRILSAFNLGVDELRTALNRL